MNQDLENKSMRDSQSLEELAAFINLYPSDIKAEALLADLMLNNYLPADFLIFLNSTFKRGYSKDILKAEKYPLNPLYDILAIYLSRDGIYDLLPEGIFHEPAKEVISSARGMASQSKKEAKVEEDTRKFFRPVENEFFYQRMQLELQERNILQHLRDNNLGNFFHEFWKIDPSIPEELSLRFISMLPFTKKIVGDFETTCGCLGAILGENITHSIHYSSETLNKSLINKKEAAKCILGKTSLGVDMINNGDLYENCKVIKFRIGPLQKSGIEPYLEDGEISRFINCFCGYFLPLEMDYEFDIINQEGCGYFTLDPAGYGSVLGFSSVI